MNKIQLSIYSVIVFALHGLYAQDISLFPISNGKIGTTPKVIADITIPPINNREIPVRLFDTISPSNPETTHTLHRSQKSVHILSEWQITLPKQEIAFSEKIASSRATYEKLLHDFPDTEISLPSLLQPTNVEIIFCPKSINPVHYFIQYTPFSVVDMRNRCIPSLQCSPLSTKGDGQLGSSSPQPSIAPSFVTPSIDFSIQGILPSSSTPILSHNICDKSTIQNVLCFPQVVPCIHSLQKVTLTDDLYIRTTTDITKTVNWQPQLEVLSFSTFLSLLPEIPLPIIHTSISRYIPNSMQPMFSIELPVHRPMTFLGPFHYMENFALLPNLEDLHTISYRDEFVSTTSAMPNHNGEYYFSITLTPNERIAFPPIPQTVFFLIDRSSHISIEQFNSFQRGVIRALPYLPNHSKFNIAFFDEKISFLHPMDLKIGSESIQKANAFVRSGSKRLLFGSTDIYAALHTIQKEVPPMAHTSFILLTNRKSLQSGKNAQQLSNFIKDYRETCTLYIASVGDNSIDIPNVEEYLCSDTHATFPRRLATLVKNISFPIANHLKVSAITEDPNLHIELFPNSPIIHQDRPFIIYGKMDHLKNFQLILQGNNVNSWINITKSIVFNTPTHSTKSLAKHFNKPEKSRL